MTNAPFIQHFCEHPPDQHAAFIRKRRSRPRARSDSITLAQSTCCANPILTNHPPFPAGFAAGQGRAAAAAVAATGGDGRAVAARAGNGARVTPAQCCSGTAPSCLPASPCWDTREIAPRRSGSAPQCLLQRLRSQLSYSAPRAGTRVRLLLAALAPLAAVQSASAGRLRGAQPTFIGVNGGMETPTGLTSASERAREPVTAAEHPKQ